MQCALVQMLAVGGICFITLTISTGRQLAPAKVG
jgi:hypothetical protein